MSASRWLAASVWALLKAVHHLDLARYEFAQPEECQRVLRNLEADLAAFKEQPDGSLETPDRDRVEALENALFALERDMRENPAVRRRKSATKVRAKDGPEIAVSVSTGAVF
jgi:hypothetical protein